MPSIKSESDLGAVYLDWRKSLSKGGGHQHIRFGQYVYNNYDIEHKNSYNERDDNVAYNLLLSKIMGNVYEE